MTDGFISGSVAGATGLVVGHPFDTIKVRLQTSHIYNGFTHCTKRIITEEGFRALFKGMMAPMASVSAMNAVFFGVYTGVLKKIDGDLENPKIRSTWLAGTASGIVAGFISGPTELIKCRLQVTDRKGMSNADVIRGILEKDGVRGLGRGLSVTLFRELISCGIYFSSYEALIQWMKGPQGDLGDLTTFHLFLAGGIAGMVSWGINYPVDVVKSRIQIDGMDSPRKYSNCYNCFRELHAATGWSGLYRGVSATLYRAFPTNAAMLPAYSMTLALLTRLRTERQPLY